MYGKGLAKGLGITLGHHMKKKITKQYPEEKPDLAPRFRGSLEYNMDKCIGCGACVKACPNGVLELTTAKGADGKRKPASFAIDHQYCMFCSFCVEACPTKGLYFTPNFELACFNRDQSRRLYKSSVVAEPAPGDAEPTAEVSEQEAALVKKQEMVKKLASQMGALKKELKEEGLAEEERQKKEERLAKLTAAFTKANQEVKQLKAEMAEAQS